MITPHQAAELLATKVAELSRIIPGYVSGRIIAKHYNGRITTDFEFGYASRSRGNQFCDSEDMQKAFDALVALWESAPSTAEAKRAQAAQLLSEADAMEKEAA